MIVPDASVVVKWFLHEPGHDEAVRIVKTGEAMIAPDLVIPEVMNVLRRKQRQRLITGEQFAAASAAISGAFAKVIPAADLVEAACSLSQSIDHSVYDCFYLACAISTGCILVTADDVFLAKAVDHGHGESVAALSTWTSAPPRSDAGLDDDAIVSIMALHDRFERTLDGVRALVSKPLGTSGTTIANTGDLKPAFDSPAYARLARFIARLSRSDRAALLALCWFGRTDQGGDWSLTLSRAGSYLSDDPTEHLAYIISKIGLFANGLRRLRDEPHGPPAED